MVVPGDEAEREADARAETLAAASAGAEAAARTLTEAAVTRPRAPGCSELIGKYLAHFRIERLLGCGGMGEVFLATDMALDRPVAVKVLGRELAEDAAFRQRFIREARAQARINHTNICHIYFIGEQNDRLFFAMEYVDGENLQQRLARLGRLPHGEAIDLLRQAAAGLGEAQRHGFTHRDVKPSNLLVDRHGVVKVADFGLVKETRADSSDVAATGGTAIVGTPLYMAPEQARGDPVDFRADIYALGVTLHQLVAGAPPFDGPTAMAVVSKHLTDARPRLEVAARGAALVDALCDRMMAKRPEQRFADYDELNAALEQASPSATRPAGVWVRAFALAFDWLIALVASLPLQLLMNWLPMPNFEWWPWVAVVYFIAADATLGRTYGKRALELRIVVDGAPRHRRGIGWRRAALRWLAQWGLVYVGAFAASVVARHGDALGKLAGTLLLVAAIGLACVPLVVLGALAERAAGKRALWDRIAGTRVVYEFPQRSA